MNKFVYTSALSLLCVHSAYAAPQQRERTRDSQAPSLINIRVSRTVQAVNYRDRASTKIDFRGTPLMPRAEGKADIEAKRGRIGIKAEFEHLEPPSTFGSAYLTYVLWAISPEGNPNNLGEVVLDGSKSKLEVTTNLQTFAMIVTAEPYFAVSFPSEVVVIENVVRSDTKGSVSTVDARFELLKRGIYDDMRLERFTTDASAPLSLYEARNALRIAKAQGAAQYAPESWAKAEDAMRRAEDYQLRKQHKAVPTAAREAVQAAEDARNIAVKRQEDERVAQQQREADEQARRAKAAQEDEAQRRAEAERQRLQAEVAAAQEAKARAEADAQRQAAMLQEQQAREQRFAPNKRAICPASSGCAIASATSSTTGSTRPTTGRAIRTRQAGTTRQAPSTIQSHSRNSRYRAWLGREYRRRIIRHREIYLAYPRARGLG